MSIGLWAQVAVLLMDCYIGLLGQVIYRVELPVQRRLCPIFVRDDGSPGIHERFHELTGSQRTPGIWGFTQIVDRKEQVLRSKVLSLVKVLWRNHEREAATWEPEVQMRRQYPQLFSN